MYAVHASTHDVCKLAFTVQQITNWGIHIILSVPMHDKSQSGNGYLVSH